MQDNHIVRKIITNIFTIKTIDDYEIEVSAYEDKTKALIGIVLINSAIGVKKAYYHSFAKFLAQEGYKVFTYDYRGIGGSLKKPIKEFDAIMEDWGKKDLPSVIDYIKQHYPQLPIHCIGHSIGAQIIGLAKNNNHFDQVITVAGQIGFWRLWEGINKIKIYLAMVLLIPFLCSYYGYLPGRYLNSCDLPAGVAKQWSTWCRSQLFFVDQFGKELPNYFAEYTGEVHCYSFYDDDFFAPKSAVDTLFDCFNGKKYRHHITKEQVKDRSIGHFEFFRPKFKQTLWLDLLSKLQNYPASF